MKWSMLLGGLIGLPGMELPLNLLNLLSAASYGL